MPILQSDEKMRTSLQDNQINKSHKQTKSLKQLLTKAKFEEQEQNNEPTVSKCGTSNCVICDIIITGKSFKFKNGPLYHVKAI